MVGDCDKLKTLSAICNVLDSVNEVLAVETKPSLLRTESYPATNKIGYENVN